MSTATKEAPTQPQDTKAARARSTFNTLLDAHGRLAALTIPFTNDDALRKLHGEAWGPGGTDPARHYLHETVLSAYEEHLRKVLAAEREADAPSELFDAYRSIEGRFRLTYAALRAVGEPWEEEYPNVDEILWAAHVSLREGYHGLHRAVRDVAGEAEEDEVAREVSDRLTEIAGKLRSAASRDTVPTDPWAVLALMESATEAVRRLHWRLPDEKAEEFADLVLNDLSDVTAGMRELVEVEMEDYTDEGIAALAASLRAMEVDA